MRLGFFGGSFDPPHCGHLAIALAAAESFSLDQVWLAPTGRQPFKHAGAEATFGDRVAMTRLLCEADGWLLPSAIDAPHPDGTPNYTVDTLLSLRSGQPGVELFAIVGADALPELPRWREAGRLFELATWIAVSRPGHLLAETVPVTMRGEQERGRLRLLPEVAVPVSSTEIRRKLHQGLDPTDGEVPEAVLRYIHARQLYSGAPTSRVAGLP